MASNNETRNRIILGTVGFLALLGLIVIIVIKANTVICELVAGTPKYKPTNLAPITTKNFDSIANFDGYLIYEKNQINKNKSNLINDYDEAHRVYMPLKIKSLSLDSVTAQNELRLTFELDCSKIMVYVLTSHDKSTQEVKRIQVVLKEPNGNDRNCDIQVVNMRTNKLNKHFACFRQIKLPCDVVEDGEAGKKRTIAYLILNALEFEIDGDKRVIKEGKFSTQPEYCDSI